MRPETAKSAFYPIGTCNGDELSKPEEKSLQLRNAGIGDSTQMNHAMSRPTSPATTPRLKANGIGSDSFAAWRALIVDGFLVIK